MCFLFCYLFSNDRPLLSEESSVIIIYAASINVLSRASQYLTAFIFICSIIHVTYFCSFIQHQRVFIMIRNLLDSWGMPEEIISKLTLTVQGRVTMYNDRAIPVCVSFFESFGNYKLNYILLFYYFPK